MPNQTATSSKANPKLDPASVFAKHKLASEQDSLFDVEKFDAKSGRAKLVSRLQRARGQLIEKEPKQGGVDYELGHHDVVRFKPTLNGHHIWIESADEPYFPTSSTTFAQLIDDLKALVEGGHYDDQIEAALKSKRSTGTSEAKTAPATGTATKSKRGTGIGNVAKPDDAQWMAKFIDWAGKPDPSIVDPVPNSQATGWISKARRERGVKGYAARGKKKS